MAKVRTRPETGTLYLDFFYKGVRCREQTALTDSAENRKKVQALLNRIERPVPERSIFAGQPTRETMCDAPVVATFSPA